MEIAMFFCLIGTIVSFAIAFTTDFICYYWRDKVKSLMKEDEIMCDKVNKIDDKARKVIPIALLIGIAFGAVVVILACI